MNLPAPPPPAFFILNNKRNAYSDKNSGRGVTWLTVFRHKKICDACINNLRL
jgi:hypothetical protein